MHRFHSIATGLVAFTGVCAVLVIAIPLLSGIGPLPERPLIFLMFAMCSGAAASYLLIAARYIWLRLQRRSLLQRKSLTDKEFIAALVSDSSVDPFVLRKVREIAVKYFGPYGDRFVPSDRLEDDLHLSDVAPWATEGFFDDLNEWLQPKFAENQREFMQPHTFGDVVILASRLLHSPDGRIARKTE